MQVEREYSIIDPETMKETMMTKFEAAQAYNQEQMFEAMEDPTVKEVHVFKETTQNLKLAKFITN